MKKTKICQHKLIPVHKKLSEKEKNAFLEEKNLKVEELPSIRLDDPALHETEVKSGDVIKIERDSPTAGKVIFYRGVIE